MPSPLIDYNRACANDSDVQVGVEDVSADTRSDIAMTVPPQYGTYRVSPTSVQFALPPGPTDPADTDTQPASTRAEGELDREPTGTVTSVGRRFAEPANDDCDANGVQMLASAADFLLAEHQERSQPTQDDDAPPTALLLLSAARTSAPEVAETSPVQEMLAPSQAMAPAIETPGAGDVPIAVSAVGHWWQNPQRRLRVLYMALIPAVVVVNVGYEGIRDKIREIGRAIDGVASLQRQVAELKKPAAQPAQTPQAAVAPGNPITQPIPPGVMQNTPANAAQMPLPSPMGNQGAETDERSARASKTGGGRQPAAHDQSSDPDDSIPEEGKFVLATDTKKASPPQQEAKVPPANEFKLIGDK